MNFKTLQIISLAVGIGMITPIVNAAPVLNSSQRMFGFNQIDGSGIFGTDLVPGSSAGTNDGTTASTNLVGEKVINGVNIANEAATMTLRYDGAAEARADGTLKVRASASLTDGFFNPVGNDPFVIDTDFNTNSLGVPESMSFESRAKFSDSLAIEGGAGLDYITIDLNFDGTFEWDGSGVPISAVQLIQEKPGFSNLFNTSVFNGTEVDETIISDNIQVTTGGLADISFSLNASIQFDPFFEFFGDEETDFIFGTADFFNTLTFGMISGFDANGNPIDISSATGSSGFAFDTLRVNNGGGNTSVPAPGALGLMGFGLMGIGLYRRRNTAA